MQSSGRIHFPETIYLGHIPQPGILQEDSAGFIQHEKNNISAFRQRGAAERQSKALSNFTYNEVVKDKR